MTTTSWNGGRGDWNSASHWSAGIPTGPTDAVIDAPGRYRLTIGPADQAIAHSLDMNAADASLAVDGSFSFYDGPFALQAGTVRLNAGGVLQGSVLSLEGGSLQCWGGTLHVTSLEGDLKINRAGESLYIAKDVAYSGAGGTGGGTIELTGAGATLTFFRASGFNWRGPIDNVTIKVGNALGFDNINFEAGLRGRMDYVLGAATHIVSDVAGAKDAMTILGGGGILTNNGTIDAVAAGGTFTINYAFANNGQVNVSNGNTLTYVAVSGGGVTNIASGGTLEIKSGLSNGQLISFADSTGILKLDENAGGDFTGTIGGLRIGDTIDLLNIASTSVSLDANDLLNIKNNSVLVSKLQLAGDYSGITFGVASDGSGGTLITMTPAASSIRPAVHAMSQAMAGLPPAAGISVGSGPALGTEMHAMNLARPIA